MKALMIDTSSEYLYVLIYDITNNNTLFSKNIITHNNHSENLLLVIEEGLNELNIQLKDIDEFIVGIGPGSYTGLRVGCAVSKMASYTLNKTQKTISSLLFCGSGYLDKDGLYLIKSKAKKDYSYFTIIEVNNGKIKKVIDDTFVSDMELECIKSNYKDYTLISEENYLVNPLVIYLNSFVVDDIHNLTPNYLRKANQ